MARKVIWSNEAATDLEKIAEYISKDSSFYASAFVSTVKDASRSLNNFPEMGRIVPELGNLQIRELLVKGYRLIYNIEEDQVVILALVHGARDLEVLWGREKNE